MTAVFVFTLCPICFTYERCNCIGYYIIGVLGVLICLVSCIVDTALLIEIQVGNYYNLDQNWFLNGLDQYRGCSSEGFNEAIEKTTVPFRAASTP